jgi:hypothetical protein
MLGKLYELLQAKAPGGVLDDDVAQCLQKASLSSAQAALQQSQLPTPPPRALTGASTSTSGGSGGGEVAPSVGNEAAPSSGSSNVSVFAPVPLQDLLSIPEPTTRVTSVSCASLDQVGGQNPGKEEEEEEEMLATTPLPISAKYQDLFISSSSNGQENSADDVAEDSASVSSEEEQHRQQQLMQQDLKNRNVQPMQTDADADNFYPEDDEPNVVVSV